MSRFRLGKVDYFIPLLCGRGPDGHWRSKRISAAAVSALMFKPEAVGDYPGQTEAELKDHIAWNRRRQKLAQREVDEAPFIDEEPPYGKNYLVPDLDDSPFGPLDTRVEDKAPPEPEKQAE